MVWVRKRTGNDRLRSRNKRKSREIATFDSRYGKLNRSSPANIGRSPLAFGFACGCNAQPWDAVCQKPEKAKGRVPPPGEPCEWQVNGTTMADVPFLQWLAHSHLILWRSRRLARRSLVRSLGSALPGLLIRQAEEVARREGTTVDSIIAIALSSQVSAWKVRDTFEQRTARGKVEELAEILASVPDVPPGPGDEM